MADQWGEGDTPKGPNWEMMNASVICEDCAGDACPTVYAAANGHRGCLKLLPKEVMDKTGASPVHAAAKGGHLECLKYLIELTGADFLARDGVGGTPGHHAAFHGQKKCLQFLLDLDERRVVESCANDGGTPAHFAAATGHLECLKLLHKAEEASANEADKNGATPLYFAAQEGHLNCVKWLVKNARANPLLQASDGMCAVHAAAQAGQRQCLKFLLKHCQTLNRKIKDNDGATPLHFAAAKGHSRCTMMLLMAGGTGDETDEINATPVHDAAEQGQLQALKVLAAFDAHLEPEDSDGLKPLDLATEGNHNKCVEFLKQAIKRKKQGLQIFEGEGAISAPKAGLPSTTTENSDNDILADNNNPGSKNLRAVFASSGSDKAKEVTKETSIKTSDNLSTNQDNNDNGENQKGKCVNEQEDGQHDLVDFPEYSPTRSSTTGGRLSTVSVNEEAELFAALDDLQAHMNQMAEVSSHLSSIQPAANEENLRPKSVAGSHPTDRPVSASNPVPVMESKILAQNDDDDTTGSNNHNMDDDENFSDVDDVNELIDRLKERELELTQTLIPAAKKVAELAHQNLQVAIKEAPSSDRRKDAEQKSTEADKNMLQATLELSKNISKQRRLQRRSANLLSAVSADTSPNMTDDASASSAANSPCASPRLTKKQKKKDKQRDKQQRKLLSEQGKSPSSPMLKRLFPRFGKKSKSQSKLVKLKDDDSQSGWGEDTKVRLRKAKSERRKKKNNRQSIIR